MHSLYNYFVTIMHSLYNCTVTIKYHNHINEATAILAKELNSHLLIKRNNLEAASGPLSHFSLAVVVFEVAVLPRFRLVLWTSFCLFCYSVSIYTSFKCSLTHQERRADLLRSDEAQTSPRKIFYK